MTKYKVGGKVFVVKDDNIFETTVREINVSEVYNEKETIRVEVFIATHEEKIGMLAMNERVMQFDDKATNTFSTKKEALSFIETLKAAKELVYDNEPIRKPLFSHEYVEFGTGIAVDCCQTATGSRI